MLLLLLLDFVVTGDGTAIAEGGTCTDVGGPTTTFPVADADSSPLAVARVLVLVFALVLAMLTTLLIFVASAVLIVSRLLLVQCKYIVLVLL